MIRHVTLVGFWINAILVALKLFFGYWGHSDALVADGYHSISDFITDLIVIVFASTAYKKADKEHPYGHGKFETMASLIIGFILMLVALFIFYGGVERIIGAINGEILSRPDVGTIIVAIISIAAKEGCYRYTKKEGEKVKSSSLIANAEHHRSDAVSSVVTLIGVGAAYFLGSRWRILDPIASVAIAGMILISAYKIAKPSIDELLEISLPEDEIKEINELVRNVDGVKKLHNLRARKNGHSTIIEMNVHVDPDITVKAGHLIANNIENILHSAFGNDIITYIHIEPQE
ncbi:MAG: cation diffusion facilitator family transporter [Muribaculaceae bacterium]|nr:cation diffusion facilitator family transporter [Muribaculaceae bacterium]